jgi:restriction system protein
MTPGTQSLENWLAAMRSYESSAASRKTKKPVWSFPSDEILEEYIATIDERDEKEVELVLRHLLMPSCAIEKDHETFDLYLNARLGDEPNLAKWCQAIEQDRHFQRAYSYYGGKTDQTPWEGIRWVMHLLPDHPHVALRVIEAYFIAHMGHMTDSMIHASSDAEAVIRARYIGIPESQETRRRLLYDLDSRGFERLVKRLFERMGYETELTPPQKDGGRDINARRKAVGGREHVLIECKRYERKIGVEHIGRLIGIVSTELANKGILVTSSDFTRGARDLAGRNHRVELIGGLELVVLLNEYLGWTWPARLENITREQPFGAHRSGPS